jgi:hypothetical protein
MENNSQRAFEVAQLENFYKSLLLQQQQHFTYQLQHQQQQFSSALAARPTLIPAPTMLSPLNVMASLANMMPVLPITNQLIPATITIAQPQPSPSSSSSSSSSSLSPAIAPLAVKTENHYQKQPNLHNNQQAQQQNQQQPAKALIPPAHLPLSAALQIVKQEPVLIEPPTPSPSNASITNSEPASPHASRKYSLDKDIPRHEIEGDIEVILTQNMVQNLKVLNTGLTGCHSKKFGFRQAIDVIMQRPTFPYLVENNKRSAANSSMCEIKNSAKKIKLEKMSVDDENGNDSDDENRLVIDLNPMDHQNDDDENAITSEVNIEPVVQIVTTEKKSDYSPSKLRFQRLKQMQGKKPKYNFENLDLTYHSNMARRFPGTENRTLEQQQRRDKNTLAARVSRNKTKAQEHILEQRSLDSTQKNVELKRQIATLRVYANELLRIAGHKEIDFGTLWEENLKNMLYNPADENDNESDFE